MFVRRVKTNSSSRGPYFSHRLCQAVRAGSKVRQVTLLNLGADFPLPHERWSEFAGLVESLDRHQQPLFPPDPQLLSLARRVADRLRQRRLAAAPACDDDPWAFVLLNSLSHPPSTSVGGERVALAALEALQLPRLLRSVGLSERQASVATALLLARMLRPASELAASRWLARRSATLELVGLDTGQPPSVNTLHRCGDLLWQHRAALEAGLTLREQSLFPSQPRALALYDLTNVHHFGRPRDDLQYGRSKQKRSDCALVTLALSIDELGFPRTSEVLPGNVSEPSTLEDAIARLEARAPDGEGKPVVIMDAGISSEDNLAWLREHDYHWITVQRGNKTAPPEDGDPAEFRTQGGVRAKAWEVSEPEAAERRICVWSEARQAGEDAMLQRWRERFEADLKQLHDNLSRKGCLKSYDKVQQKVGRLKEQHKRVASQYDVSVRRGAKGSAARKKGHAAAVQWQRNGKGADRDDRVGTYELRTSCTEWDLEETVRTYWRLAEVEQTFRALKSDLSLRPVWHRKQQRIRAHLFLAVLAYHGVHWVRRRLREAGIRDSWTTIRQQLRDWRRVTTVLETAEGGRIENRQDEEPDERAAAIAAAVGLEPGVHRQRVS